MSNSNEKQKQVEKILYEQYCNNGYLLEDDIIDVCIDHDMDILEIDSLCDRLLNKKMIVKDSSAYKEKKIITQDSFVDRSHLDYDALFKQIGQEYPNCKVLIKEVGNIIPPQSHEWQNLIVQAQQGNSYAKDRIIKMYLRTVMKQAYYFSKECYCDFEDAFQNGVIGLMNAIDKFDVTNSDGFSAYFSLWVRQNMQRECVIKGTELYYPAHYRDRLLTIVADTGDYLYDDNFEQAVYMVADETIKKSQLSLREIVSYILPYQELPEQLVDDYDALSEFMQNSVKEYLLASLETLRDREKMVIEMRYGINDGNPRTLEEVGRIMGVTRERIRQIENKALKKMRLSSRSKHIKEYL
jgi:RNA polymerase primary sigma factor